MSPTPTSDLVFLIQHDDEHNRLFSDTTYGHMRVSTWVWDELKDNVKSTWRYETSYHGLVASCQYSSGDKGSYAHRWGFRPDRDDMITTQDLDHCAKTLRGIAAKLDKLEKDWGAPTHPGSLLHSRVLGWCVLACTVSPALLSKPDACEDRL